MVVLIEAESRKALLEMLVAAGRDLSDELRVSVNYTTTLSANPVAQPEAMAQPLPAGQEPVVMGQPVGQ